MKNIRLIGFPALALAVVLSISSCKQKEDPQPVTANSVKFEFTNQVDGVALELNKNYVTAGGETYKINMYRYYISNIVLTAKDGKTYTEAESYHLIDQSKPDSRKFTISNVPVGEYTSVTFMIGVDSFRNTDGAQSGALDVDNDMFWDWNTGYVMAKMEGISPSSPKPDSTFRFHISGFAGPNKAIVTKTLAFPNNAVVSGSNIPNVHIFGEVQEWFKAPNVISFTTYYDLMMVTAKTKQIADNYSDMFKVDHVDN